MLVGRAYSYRVAGNDMHAFGGTGFELVDYGTA